ncbi:thioredoxin reductase [Bacillus sp. TS-2]|nr:thioredoxin reductase [Bacillus sp. TS-2]
MEKAVLDCMIIGGGPAGLNAALVLGRARKKVLLFDDNQPRNAVVQESHGFITRDGISPKEFRSIAKTDISKYPSVQLREARIKEVIKEDNLFVVETEEGQHYHSRKLILATGLKDKLPTIDGIQALYGTSLFSCPFCDGWELRDKKLVVISESDHIHHYVKLIYNWSQDVVVCTNGKQLFDKEGKATLANKGIQLYEQEIEELVGENGYLEKVIFKNGVEINREGGFVTTDLVQATNIAEKLGVPLMSDGQLEVADFGRTNVEGLFIAGDSANMFSAQLIIAASTGSKSALAVVAELVNEDF